VETADSHDSEPGRDVAQEVPAQAVRRRHRRPRAVDLDDGVRERLARRFATHDAVDRAGRIGPLLDRREQGESGEGDGREHGDQFTGSDPASSTTTSLRAPLMVPPEAVSSPPAMATTTRPSTSRVISRSEAGTSMTSSPAPGVTTSTRPGAVRNRAVAASPLARIATRGPDARRTRA